LAVNVSRNGDDGNDGNDGNGGGSPCAGTLAAAISSGGQENVKYG